MADPMTIAAIAAAVPAIYTTGKEIGKDVAGLFGWKSAEAKQQDAANKLIDNFMKNPRSQFVNPQLLARAQRAAAGDINVASGVPYDTNLANQLIRGDIPPSVAQAMDRRIGQSFRRLRQSQGGQFSNRGLANSTFAARRMGDIYGSERNALTDAYMNTLLQRQQFGLNMLNQANVSAHRNMDRGLSMQQLGFNVLSNADRQRFANQAFGLNARLAQLGQQQIRRDASLEASGDILGQLYTGYQDNQRFAAQQAQQQRQFDQLLALSGGRNPLQAKADLSAVSLFADDSIANPANRFKTIGEMRQGGGGYGTRTNPYGTRMPQLQ